MAHYAIRYFFDPGSGVCLWAGNDDARGRWGYAIETSALALPAQLEGTAERLIAWHDQSIDWSYPPNPSPWSESERQKFGVAAQTFLYQLRTCLGSEYEVIDASGTSVTA